MVREKEEERQKEKTYLNDKQGARCLQQWLVVVRASKWVQVQDGVAGGPSCTVMA